MTEEIALVVTESTYAAAIREQAAVVMMARLAAKHSKGELEAHRAAWEGRFASFIDAAGSDAAIQAECEAKLRALAIEAYEASGSKAPGPGVSIAVYQDMHYDPQDAIAWAEGHAHQELVTKELNSRTFEKVANALRLPFVRFEARPVVKIAGDLEKALAEVAG